MKLLLWDIDGTLVWVDQAGRRAIDHAMETLLGVSQASAGISFGGRTDRGLLEQLFANAGREVSDADTEAFYGAYVQRLRQEMASNPGKPLAGGRECLDFFAGQSGVYQSLLTGNLQAGAAVKLQAHGLWDFFSEGAFGDDTADRNELGPLALQAVQEQAGHQFESEAVCIIGDTPADIACARAIGAEVVAIATGSSTEEELADHQPDYLFPNLLLFLQAVQQEKVWTF